MKLGRADRVVNRRRAVLAAFAVASALAGPAAAETPRYRIDASLDPERSTVEGTVAIDPGPRADRDTPLLLLLYPQRFAGAPPEFDERNARWIYPGSVDGGGMAITSCRTASGADCVAVLSEDGTTATVTVPEDEEDGVVLEFRTVVPEPFGAFVRDGDEIVLGGGWHPLLAARDAEGSFDATLPVERSDHSLTLHLGPGWSVMVDGEGPYACPADAEDGCRVERTGVAAEPPSIVVAPRWYERSVEAAGVRIRLLATEPLRPPGTYATRPGVGIDLPSPISGRSTAWAGCSKSQPPPCGRWRRILPPADRRGTATLIVAPLRPSRPQDLWRRAAPTRPQAVPEPFFRFQDADVARALVAGSSAGPGSAAASRARWTAETSPRARSSDLAETVGRAGSAPRTG